MDETLIALIANALKCQATTLSEDSGLGRHPRWDSLGHISVMVALEENYGLTVTENNVALLMSVADIRSYLIANDLNVK